MKRLFFILLFVFAVQNSFSQIKIIKTDEVFDYGRANNIIDIKIVNNTILIPVELKRNLRVYFILDSGVTYPIITDPMIVNLIDLEYERSFELTGYGREEPLLAHVADGFEYSIGSYPEMFLEKVVFLDKPLPIDESLGEPVYGILGYSFFKNFHIKIDFGREKMYIKDPEDEQRYNSKYKCFSMEVIANRPFIELETNNDNRSEKLKLLIDTGFTGAVNLYPHKEDLLGVNQPKISNYLGIGLNGIVTSTMFKLDELNFNELFKLKSVTTNLMDSISLKNTTIQNYSDGSIGVETLRRFIVVIDYQNNLLRLRRKNSSYGDKFRYNASGIRVQEFFDQKGKRKVILTHIRSESNAEQAGLLREDVLLKIDGKNVSQYALEDIYRRLNNFSEPERSILVLRNDKEQEFDFTINNEVPWN